MSNMFTKNEKPDESGPTEIAKQLPGIVRKQSLGNVDRFAILLVFGIE